jgi:hypothetical protein
VIVGDDYVMSISTSRIDSHAHIGLRRGRWSAPLCPDTRVMDLRSSHERAVEFWKLLSDCIGGSVTGRRP